MRHAWISFLTYTDIQDKWDIDTCVQFLLLSETTQKRLPGAPVPHKPCAVKELVCQRLHYLLSQYDNNNSQLINKTVASQPAAQQQHAVTSTVSACPTTTNVHFTDTMNLLLMVVCRAFPTFPRVILPMPNVTTASKTNHDVKVLQQQLMDLVSWLDSQNNNTANNCFIQQRTA
jgi:hypothetical protein